MNIKTRHDSANKYKVHFGIVSPYGCQIGGSVRLTCFTLEDEKWSIIVNKSREMQTNTQEYFEAQLQEKEFADHIISTEKMCEKFCC